MNDNFVIAMVVACAVGTGALIGTMVTQNLIYIKCLESGNTVQMCKEITK